MRIEHFAQDLVDGVLEVIDDTQVAEGTSRLPLRGALVNEDRVHVLIIGASSRHASLCERRKCRIDEGSRDYVLGLEVPDSDATSPQLALLVLVQVHRADSRRAR